MQKVYLCILKLLFFILIQGKAIAGLEVNLLESFQVDSTTPGVYNQDIRGIDNGFLFTKATESMEASKKVVEEVTSLLETYDDFMIVANLKLPANSAGMDTAVFSLENTVTGKAALAFWTNAKKRKMGLKYTVNESERATSFKHLSLEIERWHRIILHVYHRKDLGSSSSYAKLHVNCETIAVARLHGSIAKSVEKNISRRFFLAQTGGGKRSLWSKWTGSMQTLKLIFNRDPAWYIDPVHCQQQKKALAEAVKKSVDHRYSPEQSNHTRKILSGIGEMLAQVKEELSVQVENSKHIRQYLDQCGYCSGETGVFPAIEPPSRKPPVDYCSVELNSCDKNAHCILTEGGRAFVCECNVGFAGNGKYCGVDTDLDGIPDGVLPCESRFCKKDICDRIPNGGQEDKDSDGLGDVCDPDADGDGIVNEKDNCPLDANPKQEDYDGDWVGDECDICPRLNNPRQDPFCVTDQDKDGILGKIDNCPDIFNPEQKDLDQDGVGDICDNCVVKYNRDQSDADNDLVGNDCDTDIDTDFDGIQDDMDNCPSKPNPDQADADVDRRGDACDEDDDNDEILDAKDNCPLVHNSDQKDVDGDGVGDACEGDYDGDKTPDTVDACPSSHNISRTDFRNLQMVALDPYGESQVDPVWEVRNEGAEIWQLRNSDPGLAVGRTRFAGVDFSGTLFVNEDTDGDFVGVVFSYQSSNAFYVVTWKKDRQTYWKKTPFAAVADAGLQLKVVHSKSGPGQTLRNALWSSQSTAGEVTVLWTDPLQSPWQNKTAYRWEVHHRPSIGLIRVRIYQGSAMFADSGNIINTGYQGGRLGMFCFSQAKVVWANLRYKCSDEIPEAFAFIPS